MTPVFLSTANHRYHPSDFMQDPMLGGDAAMRELVDARHRSAHARRSRRRLQPHRTRTLAFNFPLDAQEQSPYRDWFLLKVPSPLWRTAWSDTTLNYECWWDLPDLPKLNFANEGVRQHVLDVAAHWIREYDVGRVAIGLSHRNPPRVLAAIPGPVPRGVSQRGDHRGTLRAAPSLWARAGTSTRS